MKLAIVLLTMTFVLMISISYAQNGEGTLEWEHSDSIIKILLWCSISLFTIVGVLILRDRNKIDKGFTKLETKLDAYSNEIKDFGERISHIEGHLGINKVQGQ